MYQDREMVVVEGREADLCVASGVSARARAMGIVVRLTGMMRRKWA